MKLIEAVDEPTLDALYRDALAPSFPPDELMTLDDLRHGLRTGTVEATAVVDDQGRMLGGAVGEWSASCRIMLLSYLATTPGGRGGGVGNLLYTTVVSRWRAERQPCLILAEVEDPEHHVGNAAHGDPVARLRFYRRQGARVLDLPYFQPALGPGQARVPDVLLLALHIDPESHGPGGTDTVAAEPIRTFLTEYLVSAEGRVAEDAATTALWRALDAPGGVPVRPLPVGATSRPH